MEEIVYLQKIVADPSPDTLNAFADWLENNGYHNVGSTSPCGWWASLARANAKPMSWDVGYVQIKKWAKTDVRNYYNRKENNAKNYN